MDQQAVGGSSDASAKASGTRGQGSEHRQRRSPRLRSSLPVHYMVIRYRCSALRECNRRESNGAGRVVKRIVTHPALMPLFALYGTGRAIRGRWSEVKGRVLQLHYRRTARGPRVRAATSECLSPAVIRLGHLRMSPHPALPLAALLHPLPLPHPLACWPCRTRCRRCAAACTRPRSLS